MNTAFTTKVSFHNKVPNNFYVSFVCGIYFMFWICFVSLFFSDLRFPKLDKLFSQKSMLLLLVFLTVFSTPLFDNYKNVESNIELRKIIDKNIIGGAIITIGDSQIDASVSKKILELKQKFNKNLYIQDY